MNPSEVLPPKADALAELFPVKKPIIGVIHLPPLPGAPRYVGAPMREIYAAAAADARTLAAGGIDGIMIENASDMPFSRPEDIGPETVAALTAACLEVRSQVDTPIGITCVANGVVPALAVAKAVGLAGCAPINGSTPTSPTKGSSTARPQSEALPSPHRRRRRAHLR